MVEEIKENPEFSEVYRLHNYVQSIKKKHNEVRQQATELRTMFDALLQRTAQGNNQNKKDQRKTEAKKEEKKWWTKDDPCYWQQNHFTSINPCR